MLLLLVPCFFCVFFKTLNMEKFTKSLAFLFFVNLFLGSGIFAQTPQPTANPQFLYYCLNEPAVPLMAIPSGGGALRWYGAATGGTFSTTAPTPPTATAATGVNSLKYYVTQVIGGVESTPRTVITVYVNQQLGLFCDKPKATLNSVEFDFSNVGQTSFIYSYTVSGGPPITGVWVSPSHFEILGLSPGQSVTFTLTAIGAPSCVVPETDTCYTICTLAQKVIPTFDTTPTSYCLNEVVVFPLTSTNGIRGTWSPSVVNTSVMGSTTYTFTPDPIFFPCALESTLDIIVEPIVPDFTDFSICSGDDAILSSVSPNGIKGAWSPTDTVDSSVLGIGTFPFTFTPYAGQACITPTDIKIINVTVNQSDAIVNLDWTVTDAFVENQIVSVTEPVGVNYLYQLDDGPFQVSTVFEYVSLGTHSITVKDVNGCSEFTDDDVLVIGYPRFFTPNGDSHNDTWNIDGLKDQTASVIRIFDRYGKFLKEITPAGMGWDGMYNGQPMPGTDYWFVVDYADQNGLRIFKSHFSLKR
jgi:gliding motility-associated-like protein